MATSLTIKATNVCASQGHATIEISGDTTFSFRTSFEEIETELQNLDNEQVLAALIKIARITRTVAQVKTALASAQGLAVTI